MASAASTHLEDTLLIYCAREYLHGSTPRVGDLLRETIDWNYLLRTAARHGVMPLLYRSLRSRNPEEVPAGVLAQLRDGYNAGVSRNQYLTGELLHLLRSLEEEGLVAIPFKGPVLASTVYGDLGLRQFTDLDILVREQDFLKVKALLVSRGYKPWAKLSDTQEAAHILNNHAYTFIHTNGLFAVDVHWRIVERASPLHLDLEYMWRNSRVIDLYGAHFRYLPPEDTLTILYVHGSRSRWEQLKLVCDLAALLSACGGSMDWRLVMRRAGEQRSRRMLYLGLRLADELLGATMPGEILEKARADSAVSVLCTTFRKKLFPETHESDPVIESVACFLQMREKFLDRCLFILRYWTTPNEKDHMFLVLPPGLGYLSYLVRPVRLLKEHGLRAAASLLKRFLGL
jgi:hypothetical protein